MSDTILSLGDDNQQFDPATAKSYLRLLGIGASALPTGAASLVLPAGTPGASGYIPGALTGLYGFIGHALPFLGNLALNNTADEISGGQDTTPVTPVTLPDLPGTAAADQLNAESMKRAAELIPHPTPQTTAEQTTQDVGRAVGTGFLPAGGVVDALSAAGKFAKPAAEVLKWAFPATLAPVGAPAFAGAATAAADAIHPPQPEDQSQVLDLGLTEPQSQPSVIDLGLGTAASGSQDLQPQVLDLGLSTQGQTEQESPFTWGETGLLAAGGVLTAVAAAYHVPSLLRDAASMTRLGRMARITGSDEQFYRDANDFNTALAEKNAALSPTSIPVGQAPLPGNAGSVPNRMAASTIDRNAVWDKYHFATAPTPSYGEVMRAKTGMANNDEAFAKQAQAFYLTGVDAKTGMKLTPLADIQNELVGNLSKDQLADYSHARWLANELNNRSINFRNAVSSPTNPLTDAGLRVNFAPYDSSQLTADLARIRTDPAIARALDATDIYHLQLLDLLKERGFIDEATRIKLRRDHPNYLASVDQNGIILSPFETRDLTPWSGVGTPPATAWDIDQQHTNALLHAMYHNDYLDAQITSALNAQARDPGLPVMVRENLDNVGNSIKASDRRTIAVRQAGQLRYYNVDNELMRSALQHSPPMANAIINVAQGMKRIFANTVTGPLAAMVGHVFAAMNAARTADLGITYRPPGMTFGYLDEAANRLSGGRFGLPGVDLTGYPAVFARAGVDLSTRAAGGIARSLLPDNDAWFNNTLRNHLGDPAVDAMQLRLQHIWEASNRYEMMQQGLTGGAGYSSTTVSQYGLPNPVGNALPTTTGVRSSPFKSLAPDLYYHSGPFFRGWIKFGNIVREAQNIVSEAGQSHMYAMNRGKVADGKFTQDELNYITRQFAGDPGTHGSNELIRNMAQAVPWFNVAIQDIAARARAFIERPLHSTTSLIAHMGALATLGAFTAMIHGQDAIDYYNNELSSGQAASGARIWIPGQPANQPLVIPFQQTVRGVWALMQGMVFDAFALKAHANNPDLAQRVWDGMTDLFSKHISVATMDRFIEGISSATPPVTPPILDIIEAAQGRRANLNLKGITDIPSRGPADALFPKASGINVPGNTFSTDPLTNSVSGKWFQDVFSAGLGFVGQAVTDVINHQIPAWHRNHSLENQWDVFSQDWTQRLKDEVPLNNLLWHQSEKASIANPLVVATQRKLDALLPLANYRADATSFGQTRRGGVALPEQPGATSPFPKDPTMQQLYILGGKTYDVLQRKVIPRVNDIRKEIHALDTTGLPANEIRQQRNALVKELTLRMEDVSGLLTDTETEMSRITGGKVNLNSIDWTKGPEQFNR